MGFRGSTQGSKVRGCECLESFYEVVPGRGGGGRLGRL